jgi:hypothetical protein
MDFQIAKDKIFVRVEIFSRALGKILLEKYVNR